MKRNPFGLSLALHLFTMFLGKLSLLIHVPLWVLRGAASASHCSSQSKVAILLVDDSGQVDFHAAQHSRQEATKAGKAPGVYWGKIVQYNLLKAILAILFLTF